MASLEPQTVIKNRDFYNRMNDFLKQTNNLFKNTSSSSNPFYMSQTNYNKLKSKLPNIPVYRTYFKCLLYSESDILDIINDEAFHNDDEKNALRQHVIQYYPSDLTPSHNTNNYNFSLFNDIYTRFRFFKIAYYANLNDPNSLSHYIEPTEPARNYITGYGFFRVCGIAGTYTPEVWTAAGYPSSAATAEENNYGLVPVLTHDHGGTLPDEFRGTQGQYNLGLLTNQNEKSRFILKKWIGGDDGKSVWYRYDVLANKLNSGNSSLKDYKSRFDTFISELDASKHEVITAGHANRLISTAGELANDSLHPFANYYYLLFSNLCIIQGIKARLVFHPASNTTYTDRRKSVTDEKNESNCYIIDNIDIFSNWTNLTRNKYTFQHYDEYFHKGTTFGRGDTETFDGWTTYEPSNSQSPDKRTVQRNCKVGDSFVLLADYTNSGMSYHFYPVMHEPVRLDVQYRPTEKMNCAVDGQQSKDANHFIDKNGSQSFTWKFSYYGKVGESLTYKTTSFKVKSGHRSVSGEGTYYREVNWAGGTTNENKKDGNIAFNTNKTESMPAHTNMTKSNTTTSERNQFDGKIEKIWVKNIYYRPRIKIVVVSTKSSFYGVKGSSSKSTAHGNTWNRLTETDKQRIRDGKGIKFRYTIFDRSDQEVNDKGWKNFGYIDCQGESRVTWSDRIKPNQDPDKKSHIHSSKQKDYPIRGWSVAKIKTIDMSMKINGNRGSGGLQYFYYDASSESYFVF